MIAALTLAALTAVTAHRSVSTASPQAQASFDAGLTMLYAYNPEAARADFAAALAADPRLAMAAWGEALANGTDLNTSLNTVRFDRAQAAARVAVALERFASAQERSLIEAVAQRYAGTYTERAAAERRYSSAMAAIVARSPNDDDAATLYVEALLELHSTGALWNEDGSAAGSDTDTIVRLIDAVLRRDSQHLMANHLCIHAYDDARDRTAAIACADRLAGMPLAPQAEHLAHMPAHAYIETGAYGKAIAASERAYAMPHTKYAAHDAYVGWNAAMMLGDEALAQKWGARFGNEAGIPTMLTTLARFGRWQSILASAARADLYKPFALGMAYAHSGDAFAARAQQAQLKGAGTGDLRDLLAAAIAERQGNAAAAISALRRALDFQDQNDGAETLPLFPAGEALGALYYRNGQYDAAREAFAETLLRYPNDPRALYGMALALRRLGQTSEAAQAIKNFEALWEAPPPRLDDL